MSNDAIREGHAGIPKAWEDQTSPSSNRSKASAGIPSISGEASAAVLPRTVAAGRHQLES